MDVMWGIVSTLVYIVAVFIAVEFCCGRIKKYSKRDDEEEASGRRKSAPALQADAAREGGATAADTTTEAEAVVEKVSPDEEHIRTTETAPVDVSYDLEVSPEPEVTVDIHKEPPMPEAVAPDIEQPEVNIPENVHVEEEAQENEDNFETLETVPKKVQQVVEPEVEVKQVVEPEEEVKQVVEPEVEEFKPEMEEFKPVVEEVEPEVEDFEPEEEEDEGDAAVAATKIQAGFRGHQSRKKVKKLKEEKDAAVKIQAGFRGWKTRKQVSVKRRDVPGAEVESDYQVTEEPPTAVTEEDSTLSMPSDVTEHHVAKETASGIEPPGTFADAESPVEQAAPEVPSPVVESSPTELFAEEPDTPPSSPEVTQPKIAETPSPTEAESPETSSPEEISPAPFSKPIPPTPPPTPADVDLIASGTEATEPVLRKERAVAGEFEPAMAKAVTERLDVLEKETVEASEKVLYQPGTEVSFVAPPPLAPEPVETVAKEEMDSPEHVEQPSVTVVQTKTFTKQESDVYPYAEETRHSEDLDPESLIAQAMSQSTPEVVVTSERTVTTETGPEGKTQTIVKVEHTVVKEITTVVTPKSSEVVTTEERTGTSVSSDERSSDEQVTVVEASDDDTFEESGLEPARNSGPKDKGVELDRNSASFTDKWEPEPGES